MATFVAKACETSFRFYPRLSFLQVNRNFCRRWSRRPLKVVTEEESRELDHPKSRRKLQHDDVVREERNIQTEKVDGLPVYEKLREPNNEFLKIMNEVKSSHLRHKKRKILVEGKRHIMDAISAGASPLIIYFTLTDTLHEMQNLDKFPDLKIYKLLLKDMKLWSNLTTPGIMAIFEMPTYEEMHYSQSKCLPMNLIIDNVRQPDNLGAMIRTAAAVGCNKVILTKGCVDHWNPKVIRGGCGAHFRIHVVSGVTWDKMENFCSPGSQVIIGSNKMVATNSDARSVNKIRLAIQHDLNENDDETITYEMKDDGTKHQVDENYHDKAKIELYRTLGMEPTTYAEIEIDPKKEVNIIIGGETEGISGEAYRFTQKHFGWCANIPMGNGVESLNSGVACGILLFHVQNLFLKSNADCVDILKGT